MFCTHHGFARRQQYEPLTVESPEESDLVFIRPPQTSRTSCHSSDSTRTSSRDCDCCILQCGYQCVDPCSREMDITDFRLEESFWHCVRSAISEASTSFRLFCFDGWWSYAIEKGKFLLIASDPVSDVAMGLALWMHDCKLWAAACAGCCLMPTLALYGLYSTGQKADVDLRGKNFQQMFGMRPNFMGLTIAWYRVLTANLLSEPEFEEQCFRSLMLTFEILESLPWSVCQIVICWQQSRWGMHILNPYVQLLILAQSFCSATLICLDLWTRSLESCGGSIHTYIRTLALLGDSGLAPPNLMNEIRNRRHVICRYDLKRLNADGVKSIAKAVQRSKLLEDITFYQSNLDDLQIDTLAYSHNQFTGTTALLYFFVKELTLNTGRLRCITFEPELISCAAFWEDLIKGINNMRLRLLQNGSLSWNSFCLEADWPARTLCQADSIDAVRDSLRTQAPSVKYCADNQVIPQICARFNRWKALQYLLEHDRRLYRQLTPLLEIAARWGSWSVVQLLIFAKADVNDSPQNLRGFSSLSYAVGNGHVMCAFYLLNANANPNAANHTGTTPLHASMDTYEFETNREQRRMVQRLLEEHADVNYQDNMGRTPLHFCVDGAHCAPHCAAHIAKSLLQCAAQATIEDRLGRTPLSHLASQDQCTLRQMLLSSQATLNAS